MMPELMDAAFELIVYTFVYAILCRNTFFKVLTFIGTSFMFIMGLLAYRDGSGMAFFGRRPVSEATFIVTMILTYVVQAIGLFLQVRAERRRSPRYSQPRKKSAEPAPAEQAGNAAPPSYRHSCRECGSEFVSQGYHQNCSCGGPLSRFMVSGG